MKSILLSVKPQQVANILNGKQTIIVRKSFPKDYQGWVYVYCTKSQDYLLDKRIYFNKDYEPLWFVWNKKSHDYLFKNHKPYFNGKVVARFWCDNVEEIKFNGYFAPNDNEYTTPTKNGMELMKSSCISINELVAYFDGKHKDTIVGKAIHISKLEIFDRPKNINEFYRPNPSKNKHLSRKLEVCVPQNYCWVESEN